MHTYSHDCPLINSICRRTFSKWLQNRALKQISWNELAKLKHFYLHKTNVHIPLHLFLMKMENGLCVDLTSVPLFTVSSLKNIRVSSTRIYHCICFLNSKSLFMTAFVIHHVISFFKTLWDQFIYLYDLIKYLLNGWQYRPYSMLSVEYGLNFYHPYSAKV